MTTSKDTPQSRPKLLDPKIDAAKGILIFLVVLGHCLARSGGIPSKYLCYNAIYLFHMPAFIALSGFLTHHKDNRTFWLAQLKLIETYFVFQALHYLPHMGVHEHSLLNFFVYSEWTMWYLPCLIIWRILVQYCHDTIKKKPLAALATCVAVSLLSGYIPVGTFLNIQRLLAFLPFFVGGFVYKDCLDRIWSVKYVKYVFFGLAAAAIPVLLSLYDGYNNVLTCAKPYAEAGGLQFGPLLRTAFFICAVSLTSVVMFVSGRLTSVQWLARLGRSSLFIYMTHIFLVIIIGHFLNGNTLLAFLLSIAITAALYCLCRLDTSFMLNPVSTICKRGKNY